MGPRIRSAAVKRARAALMQRAAAVRRRAAWTTYRLLRRLARLLGYHLVRATYYSPVPDTDRLPAATWTEPSPMPGVAFDLDAQAERLRGPLAPGLVEFRERPEGEPFGYVADNQFYGGMDAALLHAVVRHHRPARVLEIGAGHSTLVLAGALAANARDGAPATHRVVDPHPSPLLTALGGRIDLRAAGATDVPLDEFAALQDGDLLFIDTTHAVRPGGDVVYLLLEVIPALAPGVLVHVHDVYRPYEYPRALMDDWGLYWQEHHLLQALLAFNERLEVLLAGHALWRTRREELLALVPEAGTGAVPSALWLRTLRG